ncbi:nitroreductase family protein [Micromonospora tarensis]|nr:nitroreductase family protein [Micromonospora tarensis]
MTEESTQVVREYAEAVFRRYSQPLTPPGFEVDWSDAPPKNTTYPGAPMLAAPRWSARQLGRLPDLLAAGDDTDRPWTAAEVSTLASLAYAVQERRVAASWNQDLLTQTHYPKATWSRGTASGGGMYPLEIYWVAGAGAPTRPGVYHFHTAHRAWQRLANGDHASAISDACLGDTGGQRADQFLVVTVRFWKNAYKYHNFCYHVVTQDLGALLGSWQLIGRGLGRQLRPVLWFADETINTRLGLVTESESALAVVPLPGPPPTGNPPAAAAVRAARFERSSRAFQPELLAPVHRATLLTTEARPAALPVEPPPAPHGTGLALPELPAQRWRTDLSAALRRRRSSFGQFSRGRRLTAAELGGILRCAAAGLAFPTDLTGPAPLARLHAVVNDVDGLPAGSYTYEPAGHRLTPVRVEPMAGLLQRAYELNNYNMEQVAAVLAISGRLAEALDHFGPRGYRLLNAVAGSSAQVTYLAATSSGWGAAPSSGWTTRCWTRRSD